MTYNVLIGTLNPTHSLTHFGGRKCLYSIYVPINILKARNYISHRALHRLHTSVLLLMVHFMSEVLNNSVVLWCSSLSFYRKYYRRLAYPCIRKQFFSKSELLCGHFNEAQTDNGQADGQRRSTMRNGAQMGSFVTSAREARYWSGPATPSIARMQAVRRVNFFVATGAVQSPSPMASGRPCSNRPSYSHPPRCSAVMTLTNIAPPTLRIIDRTNTSLSVWPAPAASIAMTDSHKPISTVADPPSYRYRAINRSIADCVTTPRDDWLKGRLSDSIAGLRRGFYIIRDSN